MLWKAAKWLIIDVETTGFSPINDKIVEIGAVTFTAGKPGPLMGMLVNPGRPIPYRSTEVHKITDDMVEESPFIAEVCERFLPHVARAELVVGYNFPFDHRMLRSELGSAWSDAVDDKPVIDLYPWARKAFPKGQRKLTKLCEIHGITPPAGKKAHWASSDCHMLGQLLWHLAKAFPDDLTSTHPLWLRLES